MFSTINKYAFHRAFHDMWRSNQFTPDALDALFEYLENYEQDTDAKIELDVIALCCEYCEYESLEAFQKEYGDEYTSLEDIEYETQVIRVPYSESFIIQSF